MAKETKGGRWVTMRGTHVFIEDGQGGKQDPNHTPHNLRTPPPTHAPGIENIGPHNRTGLPTASQPTGGHRPKWMEAENAKQIARSEKLARSFKMPGKAVPKGTPMPKMKPLPKPDTHYQHRHSEDTTLRVHLYRE